MGDQLVVKYLSLTLWTQVNHSLISLLCVDSLVWFILHKEHFTKASSTNDFNNFKDTLYDKFNRPGYLIQRNKYYIFQPFNQNEDVPMYYRATFNSNIFISLNAS